MKKVTQAQLDAAYDAVRDCYSALYDVQSKARNVQKAFQWDSYGDRLAEDLQYHLLLAEQILADLGDQLDRDADDDDSDDDGGDDGDDDSDDAWLFDEGLIDIFAPQMYPEAR